ncbi:MAG: glycoside hydrolase family 25 protein [Pontixanthobacter sp.]
MARRRKSVGWARYLLASIVLAALLGGGWFWWDTQHWTPDESAFPDQGVYVSAKDGAVNFRTAKALGADFAYLAASDGASAKDGRFGRNLEAAKAAGLEVGAVHRFDPCVMADGQTANFVVMVPRGGQWLPPVIELSRTADECEKRVPDAAVESELITLINQVENHTGKRLIMKLSPEFQARYKISQMIERDLWLERTRFAPDYAGRPWLFWTANEALRSDAAELPIQWVVARP